MPMNATVLKAAIKTRMATDGFDLSNAPMADKFVDNICEEIISHIQANATVSTTVAVASVSGVTVGTGVSGPGAGTGTGTIT